MSIKTWAPSPGRYIMWMNVGFGHLFLSVLFLGEYVGESWQLHSKQVKVGWCGLYLEWRGWGSSSYRGSVRTILVAQCCMPSSGLASGYAQTSTFWWSSHHQAGHLLCQSWSKYSVLGRCNPDTFDICLINFYSVCARQLWLKLDLDLVSIGDCHCLSMLVSFLIFFASVCNVMAGAGWLHTWDASGTTWKNVATLWSVIHSGVLGGFVVS